MDADRPQAYPALRTGAGEAAVTSGARSPSDKAKVSRTFIGGSIPSRASKFRMTEINRFGMYPTRKHPAAGPCFFTMRGRVICGYTVLSPPTQAIPRLPAERLGFMFAVAPAFTPERVADV